MPRLLPVCCLQHGGLVPGSWAWGTGGQGYPRTEVWRQPQRECPGACSAQTRLMGLGASSDRLLGAPPLCSGATGSLHLGSLAHSRGIRHVWGMELRLLPNHKVYRYSKCLSVVKCFAYRSLFKTGAGMKVSETAEKLCLHLSAETGTYIRTTARFLCANGEWAWGQPRRSAELQNSVCGRVPWRECQTSQETHRIPGDSRRAVGGAFSSHDSKGLRHRAVGMETSHVTHFCPFSLSF